MKSPRMGKTNQKMNKKCNHIRPSGLEMFEPRRLVPELSAAAANKSEAA